MKWAVALLVVACLAAGLPADDAASADTEGPPAEGVVRVGMLTYADGRSAVCFSAGFLDLVGRSTAIHVQRTFVAVALASDDIYRYPFIVFSGEQAFEVSDEDVTRFRTYVERGGFVLASAGCSNAAWADSFRTLLAKAFPDRPPQRLELSHPVFSTLFDIKEITGRKPYEGDAVLGLHVGDATADGRRLAIVFSPLGLNDTAHAGGGCCCCGGNEVRNAAQINANALVYALTH